MANLEFCDKHNIVAYLQKSEGSEGSHQIVDFLTASHIRYALTESPTIYVSLIEQFWQTATASTLENGDMEITATIDGKIKVVSKASIRRHLKLEDSDGLSDLPTTEIFEQLALMIESHHTPTVAPSTSQPHHSPTLRDFIRQKNEVPRPSSPTQTHVADEAASTGVDVRHGGAATTVSSLDAGQGSVYGAAYTKLITKVKRLEDKLNKSRRKRKLVLSEEEDSDTEILAQEDPFKQGRKIA
ncbi:hypothetical protein Tco_1078442 [Tanacetum coccineum]|uniref:Xylulose kinase-1 n=1 Tax=Tanacetum coccineum TaxID=301880 RepID=A0ABQ5HP07_9ASTR